MTSLTIRIQRRPLAALLSFFARQNRVRRNAAAFMIVASFLSSVTHASSASEAPTTEANLAPSSSPSDLNSKVIGQDRPDKISEDEALVNRYPSLPLKDIITAEQEQDFNKVRSLLADIPEPILQNNLQLLYKDAFAAYILRDLNGALKQVNRAFSLAKNSDPSAHWLQKLYLLRGKVYCQKTTLFLLGDQDNNQLNPAQLCVADLEIASRFPYDNEKRAESFYELGLLYQDTGEFQSAITNFHKAAIAYRLAGNLTRVEEMQALMQKLNEQDSSKQNSAPAPIDSIIHPEPQKQ